METLHLWMPWILKATPLGHCYTTGFHVELESGRQGLYLSTCLTILELSFFGGQG